MTSTFPTYSQTVTYTTDVQQGVEEVLESQNSIYKIPISTYDNCLLFGIRHLTVLFR